MRRFEVGPMEQALPIRSGWVTSALAGSVLYEFDLPEEEQS